MTENYHVFLSYSRNDKDAAALLRAQLERSGLSVFKDDERIRAGELWLDRLQGAVDGCGAFVVLVGRDGVRRWIGAETQAALNRYFGPHDDAKRLPIFPILLDGTEPETLPAFLRLFQMTPWSGAGALPDRLLANIATARSSPRRSHSRSARLSAWLARLATDKQNPLSLTRSLRPLRDRRARMAHPQRDTGRSDNDQSQGE